MKIRDHELAIDIQDELEQFEWDQQLIRGDRFIACSPFRTERHASFAVNLDNGTFIDSGNSDEYQHKGNLVKLLSLLRQEDYETVEDYLVEKYATILKDTDSLLLEVNLVEEKQLQYINRDSVSHLYQRQSDYLSKRGISQEVQTLFETGYDVQKGCVALVWTDKKGNIINIKYRRVAEKTFFYEKGGQQIHNYLYGLYQCVSTGAKRVFICESEIDALTLWTYGFAAIATGGSSLSENQIRLLLSSGIQELVVATDNDLVGNRFREFLKKELGGNMTLFDFPFPVQTKDVNEMSKDEIYFSVGNIGQYTFSFL